MLIDNVYQMVVCAEFGMTDAVVPEGVESIGPGAFAHHASLRSVRFPDSLKMIGEEAFWGCRKLTGVTLPDSVTALHSCCFCNTGGFSTFVMPRNALAYVAYTPNEGGWGILGEVSTLVFRNPETVDWIACAEIAWKASKNNPARIIVIGGPPNGERASIASLSYICDAGDVALCYLPRYADKWRSFISEMREENASVIVRPLTAAEETDLINLVGDVSEASNAYQPAAQRAYPGWYCRNHDLDITSDVGLKRYLAGMERISGYYPDRIVIAEGVTALTAGANDKTILSADNFIRISSTVQTIDPAILDAPEILVSPNNPHYVMENGRLKERASGRVLLTDRTGNPGWAEISIFGYGDVDTEIYTQQGLKNYTASRAKDEYRIVVQEFRIREGVDSTPKLAGGHAWQVYIEKLCLPSTLQTVPSTAFFDGVQALELAPDNPYFYLDDGKLIETATGVVVWDENRPDATPAPTAN